MKKFIKFTLFALVIFAGVFAFSCMDSVDMGITSVVSLSAAAMIPYHTVGASIENNTPGTYLIDTEKAGLSLHPGLHGIYKVDVISGIGTRYYFNDKEIASQFLPQPCIDSDKWEAVQPKAPKKTVQNDPETDAPIS